MKIVNQTEKINQILTLIHDPLFVEFELEQEAPSIFNAVGRTYTETWHSALLGWLLDPYSSHGLGTFPLSRLLLFLSASDSLVTSNRGLDLNELLVRGDFSKAQVRPNERELTEVTVGKMRFDILVTGIQFGQFGEIQILIEVKVKAKISPVQCEKYIAYIEQRKTEGVFIIPVFVAPTNKMLGTALALFGDESWLGVDYQSIYDEIIEPCLQHPSISEFGNFTLGEYVKTLKYRQQGGDPLAIPQKEFDIVKDLFEKHELAIRALYEILSQSNDEFEPITVDNQLGRQSIKVRIGEKVFEERSVTKLYEQVLKFLYEGGYLDKLELPVATGTKRYLLAKDPIHQRGNGFVKPVEYKGYYMEANKSRDRAVQDLAGLMEQSNLPFKIIE